MDFPGLDTFAVPPSVSHAIFTLLEAIPADCKSIKVEFDEQGAALIMAYRPGAECSDVTLSVDAMGAAGMLMSCISYQVIVLTRMHEAQGDEAVYAAQRRLAESLAEVGLHVGLLDETLDDSITISR